MQKGYEIIIDYKLINPAKWNEFVLRHPQGTIFHSYEMFLAYKSLRYHDLIFICITSKSEILALLIAQIQQVRRGLTGYFSCRSIILSGPLIEDDNPDLLEILLETYDRIIPRKVIYTQVRNHYESSPYKDIYQKHGYKFEDHLNIIINLTLPEEKLWKNVHPKRKNEIRRAQKENLKFSAESSPAILKESYNIISRVYQNAGLPLLPFSYFTGLMESLNNNHKFILYSVKYNGMIIGCMFALAFKNTIYDFYSGALSSYYSKYPNDLLPWDVFLWAKENGYKIFDFGGAGKPEIPYGVREYKKKFGGDIVNYGRFIKVHGLFRFAFGKLALKIYKEIKHITKYHGKE
ncbi:MAG: lipid II:glycine glycyltransferase FemX [Syntrophomonadaceae bacterium]